MINVKINGADLTLQAAPGTTLYKLLSENGLMDAPCGGAGVCGKCAVTIDGKKVLSCEYELTRDIEVCLPCEGGAAEILSGGMRADFVQDRGAKGAHGMAVDIGTTTLAAELVRLEDGAELAGLTKLNSQKTFGQDVITRINYAAEEPDGLSALQRAIAGDVGGLLLDLCAEAGVSPSHVTDIAVAGNTTMIHLFMGADPVSIARVPFIPKLSGSVTASASEIGITAAPDARVFCLPAAASFVGGDITAGMLACSLHDSSDRTLFIDIGTNGEIALSSGGRLSCCSCAAGPALEGMNISCGMRAADGAIEDVTINDGRAELKVIGGGKPAGICGSGLLAAVAEMRRCGIINKAGRLQNVPLVKEINGKRAFALAAEAGLYLTQNDIRQVQLAKGAILSGIRALLAHEKLGYEEVGRVIVAGQFGAHLKAESLTGSGMMPDIWRDRIIYAGNTSLSGAYMCLMSAGQRALSEEVIKGAHYIELSVLPGYEKLFINCLAFEDEEKRNAV